MLGSISYLDTIGFPILSVVLFLPALGAIALLFIDKNKTFLLHYIAFGVTFVDFIISLLPLFYIDTNTAKMQFVEKIDWIPSIGSSYHLGVDGFSLVLVIMTTLFGWITILSTFKAITEQVKELMICILFLQTTMIGVFMSLDIVLFYLFFEAQLFPMYLMIGIWGDKNRVYSAYKYFIYTVVGSFPLILGLLALYFNYHDHAIANGWAEQWSFDLLKMFTLPMPTFTQYWVFWAFFLAFAIKVPMFPLHTWLPDVHTDAPTAGSVILAAIMLKMGTYAFVRFSLPLTPEASYAYFPIMFFLSGIAIIYTAWVCMNQIDLKKLIAYSSVAHMGYIIMGTFAINWEGLTGAILQMLNHGISTGALFLIVGIVYEQRHTRNIDEFGGLFKVVPMFTTYFSIVMLSSMGAPLLNGFVGEVFVLMGTFKVSMFYGFVGVAGVLTCAGYTLWMFQRVMLGEVTKEVNRKIKDLNFREYIYMTPLIALIFFIGIYPKPIIDMLRPPVDNLVLMTREGKILAGSEGPLALARLNQSSPDSEKETQLVLLDKEKERDDNGYPPAVD